MDVVNFQWGDRQITISRDDEASLVEWAKAFGIELRRGKIPEREKDRCLGLHQLTGLLNGRRVRVHKTHFEEGDWEPLPEPESLRVPNIRRGRHENPLDLFIREIFEDEGRCPLRWVAEESDRIGRRDTIQTIRSHIRSVLREEFCQPGQRVVCSDGVYRIEADRIGRRDTIPDVRSYIRGRWEGGCCSIHHVRSRFGGEFGLHVSTLRRYIREIGREFCPSGCQVVCQNGVYRVIRS